MPRKDTTIDDIATFWSTCERAMPPYEPLDNVRLDEPIPVEHIPFLTHSLPFRCYYINTYLDHKNRFDMGWVPLNDKTFLPIAPDWASPAEKEMWPPNSVQVGRPRKLRPMNVEEKPKRKRGRPPGSKNKNKTTDTETSAETQEKLKRQLESILSQLKGLA